MAGRGKAKVRAKVPRSKDGRPSHTERHKARINKPTADWDRIDAQVLAALLFDPKTSQRKLAAQLKAMGLPVSASTVWRRIQAIREGGAVLRARKMFQEMLPLAVGVYYQDILQGKHDSARDVAYGTGALKQKHEVTTSGGLDEIGTPEDLADLIESLPETFVRAASEIVEGRHPEKLPPGVVDGPGTPSDPQGGKP